MTANCPTHGTQEITSMGPFTIRLACGFLGNDEGHIHTDAPLADEEN